MKNIKRPGKGLISSEAFGCGCHEPAPRQGDCHLDINQPFTARDFTSYYIIQARFSIWHILCNVAYGGG